MLDLLQFTGWIVLCLVLWGSPFRDAAAEPETLSESKIQEIMETVSEIRGLALREKVTVQKMNREELSRYVQKKLKEEFPPSRARKFERTLRAFELFPEDRDLRSTLKQMLVQSIMGFYEPETDELFLIREEGEGKGNDRLGMFRRLVEKLNISPLEIYAAHELTHALQDQYFELETLPFRDDSNDDRVLAQKALIEGGASYVMYEYILNKQGLSLHTVMSTMKPGLENMLFSDMGGMVGMDVPLFVQKSLLFPYIAGLQFVLEGKQRSDGKWKALNRAYEEMPQSTEQILHPEKYFRQRDVPRLPELPEFSAMKSGDYSFLQQNRFGEYGIHLLFLTFFPDQVGRINEARTGWDGDTYRVYGHDSSSQFRYVWVTGWDSKKDAREFVSLYAELLHEKLEPERTMHRNGRRLFLDSKGKLAFLHRDGREVLVGEGLSFDHISSVIRRAWHETSWPTPDSKPVDPGPAD